MKHQPNSSSWLSRVIVQVSFCAGWIAAFFFPWFAVGSLVDLVRRHAGLWSRRFVQVGFKLVLANTSVPCIPSIARAHCFFLSRMASGGSAGFVKAVSIFTQNMMVRCFLTIGLIVLMEC